MATYNNWKSSKIRGNLYNSDYPDGSILAHATFDRDIEVKNNLYLGTETTNTTDSVTTYTNTGSIIINYQGTTYTISPLQIIQLTQTLASKDYVDQHINNSIINQIDDFVELVLLNQIDYNDDLLDQIEGIDELLNQY